MSILRSHFIHKAASLPRHSEARREILAVLKQAADEYVDPEGAVIDRAGKAALVEIARLLPDANIKSHGWVNSGHSYEYHPFQKETQAWVGQIDLPEVHYGYAAYIKIETTAYPIDQKDPNSEVYYLTGLTFYADDPIRNKAFASGYGQNENNTGNARSTAMAISKMPAKVRHALAVMDKAVGVVRVSEQERDAFVKVVRSHVEKAFRDYGWKAFASLSVAGANMFGSVSVEIPGLSATDRKQLKESAAIGRKLLQKAIRGLSNDTFEVSVPSTNAYYSMMQLQLPLAITTLKMDF